jgi:hypothetical protein
MNREELKRLWFNIDYSNVKERKQIIVDYNNNPYWQGYGEVKILREGPGGYSSFSSHEENPFLYVSERKEFNSGEYELIIK